MMEWQPIETIDEMVACLLFHPYYSHGRIRHGYLRNDGRWMGVHADGREGELGFDPTHFAPLPPPPGETK